MHELPPSPSCSNSPQLSTLNRIVVSNYVPFLNPLSPKTERPVHISSSEVSPEPQKYVE